LETIVYVSIYGLVTRHVPIYLFHVSGRCEFSRLHGLQGMLFWFVLVKLAFEDLNARGAVLLMTACVLWLGWLAD
jgi:hypothetical protein